MNSIAYQSNQFKKCRMQIETQTCDPRHCLELSRKRMTLQKNSNAIFNDAL